MGELTYECSKCKKTVPEVKLETHHADFNWLNNSPKNLDLLCTKHHAEIHSEINTKLKEQGQTLRDLYPEDMLPFFEITLR